MARVYGVSKRGFLVEMVPPRGETVHEVPRTPSRAPRGPAPTPQVRGTPLRKLGSPLGLRRQVPVQQPPSHHARHNVRHLLDGVHFAQVVPSRELVDIALQVLQAHLVVRAVVAAP